MPRKPTRRTQSTPTPTVDFRFNENTYQIDAERRKVYRRFVEIETSKAVEIFSNWRAQNLSV